MRNATRSWGVFNAASMRPSTDHASPFAGGGFVDCSKKWFLRIASFGTAAQVSANDCLDLNRMRPPCVSSGGEYGGSKLRRLDMLSVVHGGVENSQVAYLVLAFTELEGST